MTGIDHDGDGLVDLHVEDAVAELRRLHTAGTAFGTAWQDAVGRILSPGRIGEGPMGHKFMEGYRDAAESVRKAADVAPGNYRTLANNGYRGVQVYQGVDAEAATLFPG